MDTSGSPNPYGKDRDTLARLLASKAFDTPDEQSTNVGWANRLAEILTTRPQYDESTRYTTASPLVNISEGDIGRATEAAMGASGGGLSTKGIKAYHSSPHDFDKFDLAKIGTGEGAQAYGHGLYFAESPAVSGQGGQYWNQFLRRFGGDEKAVASSLRSANFDRDIAAENMQRAISALQRRIEPGGIFDKPHMADAAKRTQQLIETEQQQLALLKSGKLVGPRTYEVNINADPAHMLDWDKTFMAQPPAVQEALLRSGVRPEIPGPMGTKTISDLPVGPMAERGLKDPSSLLNRNLTKADIPGIKYLDEGSRNRPNLEVERQSLARAEARLADSPPGMRAVHEQAVRHHKSNIAAALNVTRNYVVFDSNKIDIRKKYVLPTAGTAAGALATRDREE